MRNIMDIKNMILLKYNKIDILSYVKYFKNLLQYIFVKATILLEVLKNKWQMQFHKITQ